MSNATGRSTARVEGMQSQETASRMALGGLHACKLQGGANGARVGGNCMAAKSGMADLLSETLTLSIWHATSSMQWAGFSFSFLLAPAIPY
jgi:hypothetical protein